MMKARIVRVGLGDFMVPALSVSVLLVTHVVSPLRKRSLIRAPPSTSMMHAELKKSKSLFGPREQGIENPHGTARLHSQPYVPSHLDMQYGRWKIPSGSSSSMVSNGHWGSVHIPWIIPPKSDTRVATTGRPHARKTHVESTWRVAPRGYRPTGPSEPLF